MRLQGQISNAAKEVAESIKYETGWQKYIIYDLLIHVAVCYRGEHVEHLPAEPKIPDSYHGLDNAYYDSSDATAFRRQFRCGTGAEFLRKSMLHGASIVDAFFRNGLPSTIAAEMLIETIRARLGNNERLQNGMTKFLQMRASGNGTEGDTGG